MKYKSVCIIIENSSGEFLLLLRDNIKTIQYPNMRVTLGGVIEKNESPEKAIIREIQEEIEYSIKDLKFIKKYEREEKIEYIYYTKIDINTNTNPLHEGQIIKYFSKKEIEKMNLAFHNNEIMNDYFIK